MSRENPMRTVALMILFCALIADMSAGDKIKIDVETAHFGVVHQHLKLRCHGDSKSLRGIGNLPDPSAFNEGNYGEP